VNARLEAVARPPSSSRAFTREDGRPKLVVLESTCIPIDPFYLTWKARGAVVDYNDPHVPEIKVTREHAQFAGRKSVEVSDQFDCILLATNHAAYKEIDFSGFACPLVDTRNWPEAARRPGSYNKA
jgi:UDP-N-acetyl-D-mannosaminuronate dehydrogenase